MGNGNPKKEEVVVMTSEPGKAGRQFSSRLGRGMTRARLLRQQKSQDAKYRPGEKKGIYTTAIQASPFLSLRSKKVSDHHPLSFPALSLNDTDSIFTFSLPLCLITS